ncbi:MAG TPA: cyclase family protein [Bryobacteraceae bacterium]|nr:cyclase family protein [Bryobacteraceae bacterium]
MFVSLSYPLSRDVPFWKELRRPSVEQLYDLSRGDVCNSFYFTTNNHAGTHVDGPNHFNPAGRRIGEYDVNELVFTRPAVIEMEFGEAHLIGAGDLRRMNVEAACDVLLLRSGFSAHRASDATLYVERGPGFSRGAAGYLLAALPNLKCLIVDFISIASTAHQEEGCDAHRVFLGCAGYSERTVLLVEDANIPAGFRAPKRILVVPWMIDGVDSAPCTVLAET